MWEVNSAYFKKTQTSDYDAYFSYEEAKDLIAKDRAFRGTIEFRDGISNLGLIKSDDFVKRVYAKGFNLNRALNKSEVIFCPIVDNWEQYLVINQTEALKNTEEIEEDELLSEELAYYNDHKRRYNTNKNYNDNNALIESKTPKIFV